MVKDGGGEPSWLGAVGLFRASAKLRPAMPVTPTTSATGVLGISCSMTES